MKVKEKNNSEKEISENLKSEVNKVISEKVEKGNVTAVNVKRRDASIELIRIVACITVVLTHLSLNVFDQYHSQVDWSRLFEKCFFTDGVPVFFMIIGFFIANGRSYKKMWSNTFKKIILPVLFYIGFAQIFYMFIINKQPLSWCLQNAFINLNIEGFFRTIITGDVIHINSLCAHLWYIVSYIKIIIWVPVLWLICKEEENPKLARRMIIGFGIVAMLIRDVQRFVTLPIGTIKVFEMINLDILYVLLGYELFVHKDKIKNNKKLCLISGFIFVLINVIRYKIEMQYMVMNNFYEIVGRESFVDWRHTVLNIISGLSFFITIYSFDIKNEKLSKIINWIADKTFGIYLIHYLLLAKIDLYKFDKIGTIVYELIYLVVGVIVIFTASLLITWMLRTLKDLIIKGCKKIINIRKTV